ncbi:hypothetical protein [Prosthecomicrobium sp. N25]|uniref:hypothetical protein n=1 Tax=Prosthecomicrobium sp. N25 TaxID=3129254 RepID=UPI003077EA0E
MPDPSSRAPARSALVAGEGIAVSPADALRIDASAAGVKAALAVAGAGSLFDTEPAHFDRFLIEEGLRGRP